MTTAQPVQRTKSSPSIIAERPDCYLDAHYRSVLTIRLCAELELRDAFTQAMAQLLQNADWIDQRRQNLDHSAFHRCLGAPLAPVAAQRRPAVDDLRSPPRSVGQPGPRECRSRPHLVGTDHCSKNIAADLGISQRSVESHRAAIMRKTGSASLPALVRLAFIAACTCTREPRRALGN